MITCNISCKLKKTEGLYSANKQQAQRFYKTVKPNQEYPISVRNDLLKIKKVGNRVSEHWAKIPVKGTRQLWVAIKPHRAFPAEFKVCESKLYRQHGRFFLNVAVEFDVELNFGFRKLLAVDLGEREPLRQPCCLTMDRFQTPFLRQRCSVKNQKS